MEPKCGSRGAKIEDKNEDETKTLADHLGAVLGRSWVVLGAVLGPSWAQNRALALGGAHFFEKRRF